MKKDHTRHFGDDRTRGEKLGLSFDVFKSLPEEVKPITSWHPDLAYRRDKCLDGTNHHYL